VHHSERLGGWVLTSCDAFEHFPPPILTPLILAAKSTEVATGVAARLSEFAKPALIAWSADDVFFPVEDGERLAATLPNARLEVIEGARTFSMMDQPQRLAELISEIARA
jgi:pimeloyl-ACP methyl ester carboxylesterase